MLYGSDSPLMKSEKGQATVELALTLTLLIFLIFAIIDFGRIFHAYLTLDHASREAARVASVGATDLTIQQRAKDSAPSLDTSQMSVSILSSNQTRSRGTYVTVKISYPIDFSIPLLKDLSSGPLVLNSETVMRVE
jgi:Flp pilus assembly protein TadG